LAIAAAGGDAAAHRAFQRGGVGAGHVVAAGQQARRDEGRRALQRGGAGEGGALFGHGQQRLHGQAQLAAGLGDDGGLQRRALAGAVAGDEGQQPGRLARAGDGVAVEHELGRCIGPLRRASMGCGSRAADAGAWA
jgi:hypothetical protein